MGHIEITKDIRKQLIRDLINDQKSSLDVWLDYLISDDTNIQNGLSIMYFKEC